MFNKKQKSEKEMLAPKRVSYRNIVTGVEYGLRHGEVFFLKNGNWFLSTLTSINELRELPVKKVIR